jgi:hypothetical protein
MYSPRNILIGSFVFFTALGAIMVIGTVRRALHDPKLFPTPTPTPIPTPTPVPTPTPKPTPPPPPPTPVPTEPPPAARIRRIDEKEWQLFIPGDGRWVDTGIRITYATNISIQPTFKHTEDIGYRFTAKVWQREFFSICKGITPFGHFDGVTIDVGKVNGYMEPGHYYFGVTQDFDWSLFIKSDHQPGVDLYVNITRGWPQPR